MSFPYPRNLFVHKLDIFWNSREINSEILVLYVSCVFIHNGRRCSSGYGARQLGLWLSTGTGLPSFSKLGLEEMASLICSFCFCVAASTIVIADLSLTFSSMLFGCLATN